MSCPQGQRPRSDERHEAHLAHTSYIRQSLRAPEKAKTASELYESRSLDDLFLPATEEDLWKKIYGFEPTDIPPGDWAHTVIYETDEHKAVREVGGISAHFGRTRYWHAHRASSGADSRTKNVVRPERPQNRTKIGTAFPK